MATLKLLSDEIAGALDRPTDIQFKDRIKSILKHEIATVIQQAVDKGGSNNLYKSTFFTHVYQLDSSDTANYFVGKWRTKNKIPKPLRIRTDEPFLWVGREDGSIVFIYTNYFELAYANIPKAYSNKPTRYSYMNDHIYLTDFKSIDGVTKENIVIAICGIFAMGDIITPEDNLNDKIFDDETELPISEDLIQLVKNRLLAGELSIIDNKDKLSPEHMEND